MIKNLRLQKSIMLLILSALLCQSCGMFGYHFSIYKSKFPYSGVFQNREGLQLVYRIRFPYLELKDSTKIPLVLYIDGSGSNPIDYTRDNILAHFQSKGFIAAMKQKRGVKPCDGEFSKLTFKERIQDNLDFIEYLLQNYPKINPDQIYIVGHSEGATVGGAVAYEYKKTAGLIWISACLNEDWFDIIASHHQKKIEELEKIRSGKYKKGKFASRSKDWYHQHFNFAHYPKLMEMSSPVLFLMGEKDEEYLPMKKRYEEMKLQGKQNISFYSIAGVGHGTIASTEPLFSVVDIWLENIIK